MPDGSRRALRNIRPPRVTQTVSALTIVVDGRLRGHDVRLEYHVDDAAHLSVDWRDRGIVEKCAHPFERERVNERSKECPMVGRVGHLAVGNRGVINA
jgi:hypothetical protein